MVEPTRAASIALALFLGGCSLVVGTDTRTVRDGGAGDGGAGDGGARDAVAADAPSCSFPQGKVCLDTAAACSKSCGDARDTCRAGCGGPGPKGPCEAQCANQEDACRTSCQATCATCVDGAGCAPGLKCPR
jgi:hypothetical protein